VTPSDATHANDANAGHRNLAQDVVEPTESELASGQGNSAVPPQPTLGIERQDPDGVPPTGNASTAVGPASSVIAAVHRYYEGLVKPALACLAVFGAMSLKGRTKPLSLLFEATSGFGKTAVLQMAFDQALELFVYRSDKFTPKAFVTHAASVKKAELDQIDLLPKLEHKVLVTKELSTLFRGREQEVQDNFSILISVLDGKGFTSDTGMRGRRGYRRSIVFNWLGATTPLPPATHRMMYQLGTRVLFYEISTQQPTEDQLVEYAEKGDSDEAEVECSKAVTKFLLEFFRAHPVGSVDPESIQFSKPTLRELVRWARFICAGRAEVRYDKGEGPWEPVAAAPPEGPYKVINYLKELARGHALIHGRNEIDASDLSLVGHVAISSIPGHLRPIVQHLRATRQLDTTTAAALCRVTAPTARRYLKEISLLRIADLTKGLPEENSSDSVTLSNDFSWLSRADDLEQ
jgi:hypothetical protein